MSPDLPATHKRSVVLQRTGSINMGVEDGVGLRPLVRCYIDTMTVWFSQKPLAGTYEA